MIVYNSIIPFKGYKLINIFGIIFARKNARLSPEDINHELIHTEQMKELLYIFFYIWYIIEFLLRYIWTGFNWKQAYRNLWFEQEAYTYEKNLLYPEYRQHYNWFNFE